MDGLILIIICIFIFKLITSGGGGGGSSSTGQSSGQDKGWGNFDNYLEGKNGWDDPFNK